MKADTTSTTRRAALAGAASLAVVPALALPCGAAQAPDPILAAIEAHKAAFQRALRTCRIASKMDECDDPGHEEAVKYNEADWDAAANAAGELVDVTPATMAGLLALLDYVDAFNRKTFTLDDDPEHFYSEHLLWPDNLLADDETLEQPFAFWLLLNVRAALEAMTVQS
jgi:hypothetical protein